MMAILPAAAQQFDEQSASRFPNPNPTDWTNQLTIGDIDNDGDLDLIFANGGNFSSAGPNQVQRVYINNGGGVFSDQSAARLNFSGLCRGVELGDIDNDGDLDLIFAQDFERVPQLFVNNGLGFFTNVTATNLPQTLLSSSRAQFGDIDNDGDLDLYITAGAGNRFGCDISRVYVNDGTGVFTDETAARNPPDSICGNMDCTFGDIDEDFDIDVIVGARDSASRLYKNNGSGVFSSVPFAPDGATYSYDFGDIDGDGDLDLLGANSGPNNTELLLRNDGTGAYANVSSQLLTNPTIDDNDSKFFDYDNDGDMDIIIAALGGTTERIYNNNGAGVFSNTTNVIDALSDSSLDVKVADLTGDGRLDIVTAQGESGNFQNRIYINVTGPVDNRAPRIIATEQLPPTDDATGPFVVRALVLDDSSSDRNAIGLTAVLNYRVDGSDYQQAPMQFSGGQVYRGVIPGLTCGGLFEYYVTATDLAGNSADGDTLSADIGSVISFPGGLPASLPACRPGAIDVKINPCPAGFGSASLFFRGDADGAFVEIVFSPLGEDLYRAVTPAVDCAAAPQFYIVATDDVGGTFTSPPDAPASLYAVPVGVDGEVVLLEAGFETGLPSGWTQSGLWNVTTACSLSTGECNDNPGSQVAYYGLVSQCNYDTGAVHSGAMATPPIALPASATGPITLTYCSTYQRHVFPNGDRPELFLNNGQTSVLIDNPNLTPPVAPQLVWTQRSVDLTPWAGQTVTLSFQFGNLAATADNFLGWQVDDVRIAYPGILCEALTPPIPGDLNNDGDVNGLDVQAFVDAALVESSLPQDVCPGDYDGDGAVTLDDADAFVAALTGT